MAKVKSSKKFVAMLVKYLTLVTRNEFEEYGVQDINTIPIVVVLVFVFHSLLIKYTPTQHHDFI